MGRAWAGARAPGAGARLGVSAGIFAVIALAVSATAAPSTGLFPGATFTTVNAFSSNGCAQTHVHGPVWSWKTGNGSLRSATVARTCTALHGGSGMASYADVTQELRVSAPVTLGTGAGGVNVTWALRVFGNQSSGFVGPAPACPGTPFSWSYTSNGTVVNVSGTYWACEVAAFVSVGVDAYVYDATNGSFFRPSNPWSGVSGMSATENLTNMSTTTNGSGWVIPDPSNWTTFNGTVGSPGKISGRYLPQLFINGTFVGTHHYEVVTSVLTVQWTEIFGYPVGAFAHTMIDLGGRAGHADLRPFSVW